MGKSSPMDTDAIPERSASASRCEAKKGAWLSHVLVRICLLFTIVVPLDMTPLFPQHLQNI